MSKVLVTGGAGYIGSHTVLSLHEAGYEVTVYDNLSTGFAEAVTGSAELVQADLSETRQLDRLMREKQFSSIIHFAASIVVPESVSHPLGYYRNNTLNTLSLIELAVHHGLGQFIFSSTAAVYGIPETIPVTESSPLEPINPYGRSKLMDEWILQDACAAHPSLNSVILRYFNVAGADPRGRVGQSTPQATHLIKVACRTALGLNDSLPIFGTDYPTPDGTGIRDYIHVTDLAEAHVQALKHLEAGKSSDVFNCGYGHGYSVRQIVDAVQRVAGVELPVTIESRRPGDPAHLVADPSKILDTFDWRPQFDDIDTIVSSALDWEKNRTY
jgi:UDP-glucose 4-epimerase